MPMKKCILQKGMAEIELSVDFQTFLKKKETPFIDVKKGRFFDFYDGVKELFTLPYSVHIVGTNGKGSTGRFLAQIVKSSGKKVFHYTSPHILSVNERFYIDGKIASNKELEDAHKKLLERVGFERLDPLSYFEYLTLLAFLMSEDADIAIFEAGLGGEFDATSAHNHDLLLITPISYDHIDILGDTIEKIATTKLAAIQKRVIVGHQEFKEVIDLAKEIATKKGATIFFAEELLNRDEKESIESSKFHSFLKKNLTLSVAGAKFMGIYDSSYLPKYLDMKGRVERISEHIVIDVGHNSSAARVAISSFSGKKFNLVYNALLDKDFCEVLTILRSHSDKIFFIPIDSKRAAPLSELRECALRLGFEEVCDIGLFKGSDTLVFGSFYTVGVFLNSYLKSLL